MKIKNEGGLICSAASSLSIESTVSSKFNNIVTAGEKLFILMVSPFVSRSANKREKQARSGNGNGKGKRG